MTMVVEGSSRVQFTYKTLSDVSDAGSSLQDLETPPFLQDLLSFSTSQRAGYACRCPNTAPRGRRLDSERVLLTLTVLSAMHHEDSSKENEISTLLLHTALITSVPLSQRQHALENAGNLQERQLNTFLQKFSELSHRLLSSQLWKQAMGTGRYECDVADLVDGRLFKALAVNEQRLPRSLKIRSLFEDYAHAMCAISGFHPDESTFSDDAPPSDPSRTLNDVDSNNITMMPFSNAVFDKHLKSIQLRLKPSKAAEAQTGRIYQEVSHWHNAKRRLDPKSSLVTPATEKEKFRALRRNQFFMAEMQAYAASLTNAAGKQLEPEIVTTSELKSGKTNLTSQPKSNPSSKNKDKNIMLDKIAAQKAVKDSHTDEKVFAAWRTVRTNLDSERSLRSKYRKMQTYLIDLPEQKRLVVQGEVSLHLLCILVEIYKHLRKDNSALRSTPPQEVFGLASLLWDTIRRLSSIDGLSKSVVQHLDDILKALQLPSLKLPKPANERKLTCAPNMVLPTDSLTAIGLPYKDFQLLHCGPYMDRNLDSAPDPRVPFEPDGWQRQVLDELDAKNSVFVVAPTSAGKTFISFYAMERILRADDDGVLVYVAPTKALVNQIAAEIQARFKKTYKHAGKSVWAIHTRDYRINNPSGCQILVTVPHILQIMLLAPSNAKSWSPKLRNIIFDEIHSIGQAEDGVVWEQLLLLAPCPIIALSATVGNPHMFHSWLSSTQQSSGHEVAMITHQHRYSDLRKFVFTAPKQFAFRGLTDRQSFATLGLDGLISFNFIHPVASLVNKSRGMPDDFSLEARDCLLLYRAMSRHQTAVYPVDANLAPEKLPDVIRKANIIEWEAQLKRLLKNWMADEASPFDKVLEDLSQSMDGNDRNEKQVSKGEISDAKDDEWVSVDPDNLYSTTLPLLCKLYERDALPAILFNYDRHKCEGVARSVVTQLVEAEQRYKESNPVWKAKLTGFEQYKKQQSKAKKPPKPSTKKKGKGDDDEDPSSKLDRMQDAAGSDVDPYAGFDPDAPVDGYHFAAKQRADAAELQRYFWQMSRRGVAQWLMDALQRGIGVHHAGMNRKYRQVVEMLFRKGYLRVVIATGTLALGINMPCATVVFSGDSIFLTALNFRQAAGRAGRRGFDLLGNVVFQNISRGKICRLLSSRLPDLNGHFPVTTTLVLRLFSLLQESGNSPYAIRAINSLLSQPRLYLDGPAFRDQVLHHLRFSIEYLRRQSLLSAQGAPINFAGLTSHLYFTENSSFALNALIKGEYFHQLCSEINDKESHVLRTLMVVMAHLFGRRPCREADAEYTENVEKKSSSIVFLPPLPSQAAKILREHNGDTLQVFTAYVRTFVDQHVQAEDNKLPLTGLELGGNDDEAILTGSLPSTKIRSSFVALSGHNDKFDSIPDLCRTTRGGVFLEEAVIPHLDVYPDESKTPLNAYLYDFYMHGDIETLEKANGVKKSDVWFLLNDFSLVLATVTASLANFLKLPESDLSLEDITGDGDEHNNAEDDQFADSTTDTDSTAAPTATAGAGKTSVTSSSTLFSRPKAKKKVADSWDDSDDADDNDETNRVNEETADDPTKEELERGFLNVYKALKKLRLEFDTKFRKIFA